MKIAKYTSTILIIILVLLLAWQIIGLIKETYNSQASLPNKNTLVALDNLNFSPAHMTPPNMNDNTEKSITQVKKIAPMLKLRASSFTDTHQRQYINLLNKYKIAKIQRKLLDEQVAIALLKQRIVKLDQQTTLIKHMQPYPVVHSSLNQSEVWQNALAEHKSPYHPSINYSSDEILILELSPHHYTVQIASAVHKKNLIHLIKSYGLSGKAMIYSVQDRQQTVYKLLLGDYARLYQAKLALAKLPQALKELQPRIQKILLVQKNIMQQSIT